MGNNRMTKPKRKTQQLSSAPRPAHRPRSVQNNKLAKWMDAAPLNSYEIAEKLGVSPGYLMNIRRGTRKPGRDVAVAIEQLSDGMVPVESWSQ